ncbi:MAG: flagellar biosynthesis protein FlhA [Myxococcales bacterium]|nr:flagellar biosynthesis protein FlhA [Myxococcales bacterium]
MTPILPGAKVSLSVFGSLSRTIEGAVPLILVGIVLLMVIPLPAPILDLLLATSIAMSVALLLIAIQIERPLDLSAFPAILLFGTLLRLSLNVASTRLILLRGAEGPAAAGNVVHAFGELLIGGNYVVGGTIFLLLVIINFIVISKGAGRVAEVSARFTLDALPGKQMSIDADVNAGALTQEQANVKRKEVEQESDFFGAMDGASKFVRGDAIAGLLMTSINIVVGFIVGVAQQDMSAGDAAARYTVLTVGDGLASQIPALLVSTAAGVVVTRAAAGAALAPVMVEQLGARRDALMMAAALVAAIGLLPSMPALPFLTLAGVLALAARLASGANQINRAAAEAESEATPEEQERQRIEGMIPVDLLELEVGFDLVPLVDAQKGGELVERVSAIRKNLAAELGLIIPPVHIRDNLRLAPGDYRLLVSGNEVGSGSLRVGRFLAMDPTGTLPVVEGEQVEEPAFGLPARWIGISDRATAEAYGYTVVDAPTVAATHLTEMLRSVAPELLGRGEAQELLDIFAQREPRLVDELIPGVLSLGEVIQVLRRLLEESVPIRDMRTILEALADQGRDTKDPQLLTEYVRRRLKRAITARFKDDFGQVAALVLDPNAEDAFRGHGPDAGSAQRILSSLDGAARAFGGVTTPPVVLCAQDVRSAVSSFLTRRIPGLSVVSYSEIDSKAAVRTLGVVSA